MGKEITGENVILREQREEDAEFFAYWFNQPEIMFQCGFTDPTDEEQEKEFGVAKKDVVAKELKFIKQMRFKAKAQLGRMKVENALLNLGDRIAAACRQSVSLQQLLLQRYPAVNFRNLDTLSEPDLRQLSEDMELINLIEEIEDAEQSTGEGC